jgi:hypothetical protein
MANTVWNGSDKSASVTLTGSNLIATSGAAGTFGVRAADKQITGKFYWEVTCNIITAANTGIGIMSPSASLSAGFFTSGFTGSCGLIRTGLIYLDGTNTAAAAFGTIANGTVVGIAFDVDARLIWFRLGAAGNWNNNAAYSPVTGTGGVVTNLGRGIPAFPAAVFTANGDQTTANFGDSAFVGAVPAGFTSGFTAGASIPTNTLATQIAAEQWLSTDPRAQLTQAVVEQWASVQSTTGQVVLTTMLIEQWASVDLPVSSQAVRVMVLA